MTGDTRRLFCFGFGYTAGRLARRLGPDWRVAGTHRAASSGAPDDGPALHRFDDDRDLDEAGLADLDAASHILISIPPGDDGDPVLARYGERLRARAEDRTGPVWVGYLSTTGVYGDTGGAWADESRPPAPSNARAARRVEAERGWLALHADAGLPVHVFRLPGIYGPGRSAFDQLRSGRARRIDKPGHVFSRVHVEDIARALAASMAAPTPGAVYNVADDAPAPQADVIAHAAGLLGIAPPPLVPLDQAELSPMARSFYADCRRVSNAKLKAELGVAPRYPSYREGLAAILAEEGADGGDRPA